MSLKLKFNWKIDYKVLSNKHNRHFAKSRWGGGGMDGMLLELDWNSIARYFVSLTLFVGYFLGVKEIWFLNF